MSDSKITRDRMKSPTPRTMKNGQDIWCEMRFDDRHNNGHNTFSITGLTYDTCGCIHKEIAEYFPEFKHLIKWHLCSTDGPLHYLANTLYWIEAGNLDYARSSAIWADATDEELNSPELPTLLVNRLPTLLHAFRKDMESIGFEW